MIRFTRVIYYNLTLFCQQFKREYSILEVIDSNNCAAIPTENVVQVSVFENPDVQLSDY